MFFYFFCHFFEYFSYKDNFPDQKKKEIKKPANGYLSPKGVFSLRQCLTSEFGMGSGGTTVINRRNRENYSLKTKYHVQYI